MTFARRQLLGASLAVAGGLYGTPAAAHPSSALTRLLDGNQRWAQGRLRLRDPVQDRRRRVSGAQHPHAVVFSCIDSRVPPEVVFDQDLGDLFVVRTAGEALDALVLGCVEYGPAHGVPLVFVLGHTACGAIRAAVESIEDDVGHPGHLESVVHRLEPAYRHTAFRPEWTREQHVNAVVNTQITRTVAALRTDPLLRDSDTVVAGGRYDLSTGVVSVVSPPE